MSDRLPIPARSRGGKHVAPRTAAIPVIPSASRAAVRSTRKVGRAAAASVKLAHADTAAPAAGVPTDTAAPAAGVPTDTAAPAAGVPTDTAATRRVLHRTLHDRVRLLPSGGRISARVAQGGVVAVLALALGGTVTATASARAEQTQTARVAAEAASAHQEDVAEVVGIADDVIEVSTSAQTEGQQAAVDAARLAVLQAETARLEALVAVLDEPVVERQENEAASRGSERAEAESVDATSVEQPSTDPSADPAAAAPVIDPATGATVPSTATPEVAEENATPSAVRTVALGVSALADEIRTTAEVNRAAAEAAQAQAQAEAAAAAEAARVAAEQAAQREAWKRSLVGYANGRIPASALCGVSFDSSVQLRCDAAEALEQLNTAYVASFGTNLAVSDSYRSYAGQVACRQTKGWLCAAAGTSNHGTGVAVDLGGGIQSFGTSQFAWMTANAGRFGWVHPDWAQRGGSKPEAWHWEYTG